MPDFHSSDRRKFLRNVGATTLAAGVVGIEPLLNTGRSIVNAAPAQGSNQRANDCAKLRRDAAQNGLNDTPQNLQHPNNQDESIYPNKIGSYSKGLTHNNDGTVVLSAYTALLKALDSGKQADFNAIPLGATRKLTNPQAGLAFDMEGPDSHALVQPPAPAFASREQAAEISENYWMALLRDVPFAQYSSNPIANAAAADLTLYGADFKGPKSGGAVTTDTLFRGLTPGDLSGPQLSQFFYLPCHFGANTIDQKITTVRSIADGGANYMTDFATWLSVQRGFSQPADRIDPIPHYMRNGRDIGQWVRKATAYLIFNVGDLLRSNAIDT
ncbi:MAG TPA: hypothetical protein VE135_25295 [Pyrinomonadaceae bacterium]|nr:hypothetical protein [Pyrinomonadaceae bacterium]